MNDVAAPNVFAESTTNTPCGIPNKKPYFSKEKKIIHKNQIIKNKQKDKTKSK
jgi:hypothetical protein